MPTFRAMSIATSALTAHRMVLGTIGQNIANVNTPGYARRVAHLAATYVPDVRYGSLGTGVAVTHIETKRAQFLDGRLQAENSAVSEYDTRSQYLGRLESALGEPGDYGLSSAFDAFFAGWAEVANSPDENAAKIQLVAAADRVAMTFNRLSASFASELDIANQSVEMQVGGINDRLRAVAGLNDQIRQTEIAGADVSALVAQRSTFLAELAEFASVRVSEGENGTMTVTLGGRTVVDGTTARLLETRTVVSDGRRETHVFVEGDASALTIEGGTLGSILTLRDHTIPGYQSKLDELATAFAQAVNALHEQGPFGEGLFAGTGASDLSVAESIANDPSRLAVSRSGAPGDNDLAVALAALADESIGGLAGRTIGGFYRDLVVGVGGDAEAARFGLEARSASRDQLQAMIDAQQGVSLDEEMANMLAAEHAYEAAARLMTTASEMMETLLSIV